MGIYLRYSAALLVVAFSTSVNAATITVPVAKKSVQDLLNSANPVLNENPIGYVQAYDSPFQYQQRPYSVPVKQKITIPTPAIKDAVKGALKQQAAVAVASAAISAAVAAAGWVIDEAGKPVVKSDGKPPAAVPAQGEAYWQSSSNTATKSYDASTSCNLIDYAKLGYKSFDHVEASTSTTSRCMGTVIQNGQTKVQQYATVTLFPGNCPKDATFVAGVGCVFSSTRPLQDADYETLTSVIGNQSSDMKARLAKDACKASLAPERCYQALQDAASFLNSGPSSIQGPTSNSTTTKKNVDGTSSITTTTSDTKFNTEYNSDGVTLKPEKTTTTKNPDGSTTETVEKEEDNSTTVQKPGDPEEEGDDPLNKEYTFTNPDMPEVPSFYEQKYPDGLKSVWDDNKARFDNSAFISFMKSFVPSFSGSCPTWGLPMNIMAQASYGYVTFANICYVFDFVKLVIIATAVFTARKIMFGG